MIVQEFTRGEWIDAFGRGDDAHFSYESADALYDHYYDLSESTGETIRPYIMDVVYEWTEYTEDEVREEYNIGYDEDVEIALVDRDLVNYVIKVPMHGSPHHYLVSQ